MDTYETISKDVLPSKYTAHLKELEDAIKEIEKQEDKEGAVWNGWSILKTDFLLKRHIEHYKFGTRCINNLHFDKKKIAKKHLESFLSRNFPPFCGELVSTHNGESITYDLSQTCRLTYLCCHLESVLLLKVWQHWVEAPADQ